MQPISKTFLTGFRALRLIPIMKNLMSDSGFWVVV